jgi:hypothetical protein
MIMIEKIQAALGESLWLITVGGVSTILDGE